MEAHSLASLNRLAANPPAYPNNPSEDVQEPLTLYISRVPGTRDIILSPSKPQLKNVTGEDVAGCLYYVHLEMPFSDGPDATWGRTDAPRLSSDDASSIRTIQRKPLPSSALPLVPEQQRQQQQQQQQPQRPPPATPPQVQRRPVSFPSSRGDQTPQRDRERGGSIATFGGNFQPGLGPVPESAYALPAEGYFEPAHPSPSPPKSSPRKGLGPSAFPGSAFETHDNIWTNGPRQPGSHDPSPAPSVYEYGQAADEPRTSRDMPFADRERHGPSSSPRKKDFQCTPFTLSLIRRDPGTASQWNVGKISSYQIENSQPLSQEADHLSVYSSIFPEPMPMQHPPINIQIETSGYARFRDNPVRGECIDVSHASAAQIRASFDAGSGASSRRDRDAGLYFNRQVSMAYSKSWASNLKEKFQHASRRMSHARSESQASTGSDNAGESTFVATTTTTATTPLTTTTTAMSTGTTATTTTNTASPEAPPSLDRLKARGYTFQSPWDKRCEFRTGQGGRSVQCRHILNDSPIMSYNPLVAEPPKPNSVMLSDLRFNLPAADFFPPSDGLRAGGDGGKDPYHYAQKLGHFGKFLKSAAVGGMEREGDDYGDGLVSPFDVNLGSEKAGGGPHGTRAKLGKLIIYHDGLKMLDLVVAANLGLWWGAWEKSF